MSVNKSSTSQAQSYQEMGAYWDTHDVSEYITNSEPVEFEVDIQSEINYLALEQTLANQVGKIAWKRGVSTETLLNLWVQEKVKEALPELAVAA